MPSMTKMTLLCIFCLSSMICLSIESWHTPSQQAKQDLNFSSKSSTFYLTSRISLSFIRNWQMAKKQFELFPPVVAKWGRIMFGCLGLSFYWWNSIHFTSKVFLPTPSFATTTIGTLSSGQLFIFNNFLIVFFLLYIYRAVKNYINIMSVSILFTISSSLI